MKLFHLQGAKRMVVIFIITVCFRPCCKLYIGGTAVLGEKNEGCNHGLLSVKPMAMFSPNEWKYIIFHHIPRGWEIGHFSEPCICIWYVFYYLLYSCCSNWVPCCDLLTFSCSVSFVHWKWWEVLWLILDQRIWLLCGWLGWSWRSTPKVAPVMSCDEPKTSNLLQMSTADLGENQSDLADNSLRFPTEAPA